MIIKKNGNNAYHKITIVIGVLILIVLTISKINNKISTDRVIEQVDKIQQESKQLYIENWNNKSLSKYTKKSFVNKYAYVSMGKRISNNEQFNFEITEKRSVILRYNNATKIVTIKDGDQDFIIKVDNLKRMGTGTPKYEYISDGYIEDSLYFKVIVSEDYIMLLNDQVILLATQEKGRLSRLKDYTNKFIETKYQGK